MCTAAARPVAWASKAVGGGRWSSSLGAAGTAAPWETTMAEVCYELASETLLLVPNLLPRSCAPRPPFNAADHHSTRTSAAGGLLAKLFDNHTSTHLPRSFPMFSLSLSLSSPLLAAPSRCSCSTNGAERATQDFLVTRVPVTG